MQFTDDDVPLSIDSETLRSEPHGFAPDEMIRCDACLRANPPTRTICLYCSVELPSSEALSALRKPVLRRLQKWEHGFNVVLVPESTSEFTVGALPEIAEMLRLNPEDLRQILEARETLPVARASTPGEAELIVGNLKERGLKTHVIADQDLGIEEAAPRRARSFELTENELVAHTAGGGESWSTPWNDIALLVVGRLFVREIEIEERNTRKAERDIVDAREMSADEAVLDTYTAGGNKCWRVTAGSFDFSCLGSKKDLIALRNFSTLVEVLRVRSSGAVYDDAYNRVRNPLTAVWPLEQQTESRGWRRRRPGLVSLEAVTRSDNEIQFTRYSLLRRYLQLHHSELSA